MLKVKLRQSWLHIDRLISKGKKRKERKQRAMHRNQHANSHKILTRNFSPNKQIIFCECKKTDFVLTFKTNITYFFQTCSAQEHELCPFRIALQNETAGFKIFLQTILASFFYGSERSDLHIKLYVSYKSCSFKLKYT